ncbi:hypothetical protein IQ07DRAFT_590428 [Pyrenochaeta sp. DS3sAY3a]|nr:hypothetical protein IQ07DRAFT_590428 [Pyrenochaeta sp. DS3sAY3a]
MASNDDNPRRDRNRPEDNPFIAFRRFADSQVSSLLNTVFTLPATIANYNNAHQAREQCLFGKADRRQCDKLHDVEAEISELRHDSRELFRAGDVQAVLRKSEELMRLDRQADELRREIVSQAKNGQHLLGQSDADVVEKFANAKGQEWGWSWDWGFPRPFDHEPKSAEAMQEAEAAQQARQIALLSELESEMKSLVGEKTYNDAMSSLMQAFDVDSRAKQAWNRTTTEGVSNHTNQHVRESSAEPRVWTWSKSWQWPPPADSTQSDGNSYSPRVLEQDPELQKAGVQWRAAYEDLVRGERNDRPHCMRSDEPIFPEDRHRRGWFHNRRCGRREQVESSDEPSYEYSHDHEDQHDDPPTPKVDQKQTFPGFEFARPEREVSSDDSTHAPSNGQEQKPLLAQSPQKEAQEEDQSWSDAQRDAYTELDVYEQMAATKDASLPPSHTPDVIQGSSSILSTLTTTERSVAKDGSITTKTILKKRFADGREESSETVHTQHGQEARMESQDPWKPVQQIPSAPVEKAEKKSEEKKGGWFWSS